MPQQPSRGGEDDGAQDETKIYHTEGEQEEKAIENVPGTRDSFDHLNDIKSSLVNEGESVSSQNKPSTNSQRNNKRSLSSTSDYGDPSKDSRAKKVHGVCEGNKSDHIPRFSSYPNLAIIASGYHPNGSIIPGGAGSKMPVVHPAGAYPPSLAHLMMYNQEHYPPGTPPPPHLAGPLEVDSKTGIPRRHPDLPLYHPLSPGSLGQVPHHLEVYNMPWQGQPFYPLSSAALRSPYPIVSGSSMHLSRPGMPPPHIGMPITGIPHPAIVSAGARQHDAQQQSNDRQEKKETKADRKKKNDHIKKPLNAFMLYMKEMRASVVKECTLKESAAINQILGRRWHALSREEQAKYYELARKERQLHMQLYPGWSARDNYAVHGKKKKKKKDKNCGDNGEPSTPKKCRARFGVDQQDYWCKPCRRKKKCIRYVASDENGVKNGDDEDDSDAEDMEHSQPGSPLSPICPKPSTSRSPNNSMHNSHPPPEGHSSHSATTAMTTSTSSSSSSSSKTLKHNTSHPAERSVHSSLQSALSSSHHHTPSMPRPMSQPPSPFAHQPGSPFAHQPASPFGHQPASPFAHSPAIVHIPHPSGAHSNHFPGLTTQPPVLVYPSSPMSMFPHLGSPEALRSHHLVNGMPPPGLISSVPSPPRLLRRNGSTDVPQDLSMKSATVSA